MRSFSKKLAFALAAAMVLVTAAPAAQAKAADDFSLNRTAQTLYVNKGVNDKGVVEGLTGNVQKYDFNLKNKPADWKDYGYKWSSSNEKVATVVSGGVTTAVGVGEATITCVITDKATGKTASTLTAKVTVKANAKDVVISNAAAVDGQVVDLENNVVDLNRTLVDENGNKSATKGKYVTDLTMWVAEPSEGVEINQSNGQFTFTEAAAAGEYKLYCYTYQSTKYTQPTATSEPVVVEFVNSNEFEVKQDSTTKLTLNFASPVKALATADVAVVRLLELANTTYEYPVVVKAVKLAEDGLSATVEVFTKFVDDTKYVISVEGFEDVEKTMSVGKPVSMTIGAKGKDPSYVLTTGTASELVCTFYDEEGVDVTAGDETVIFRLETRSTDGSYYLAGKNLTIKKEGVVVNVIAEYQGWIENGKRVGTFSETQEFLAMDAAQVVVGGLNSASVNGKDPDQWDASLTMRKSAADAQLKVILNTTDGEKTAVLTNDGNFKIGNASYKVTFTAITPDVAVVNSNTGAVTAFKTGTALFYVNLHAYNNSKWDAGTPIAVVEVVVEADAAFSYVTLDNNAITVGTADGFNTGSITLTAYDTYDTKWNITDPNKVTVKCITDGFAETLFNGVITKAIDDNKVKMTIDAKAALALFPVELKPAEGEAAVVYFSATYENKTVEFSVMIQVPGEDDSNYIQIEASATSVDALRKATSGDYGNDDWNDNTEKVKNVSFTVYEMNNGVKVKNLDFGAYPADGKATSVSTNAYVYKVTKDGEDFKGAVSFVGNKVSFDLSTTKNVSNSAVNVDIVDYNNYGAGIYEFALYKCYGEGDDRVLVQEYSNVVVVTVGDAGSYNVAGDKVNNEVSVSATYNAADAEEILKSFVINDKSGNAVVKDGKVVTKALYYVDYTAPVNADYVYVKEITFYESVGGAYVPYVVTIDDVLTNK